MNVELSPEDALRIHVLLQNNVQAIRLDESFMILYGLTEEGEASIPLSPNCNTDKYLTAVREVLSTAALGTSGGYPLYLRRWSRMGQTVHSRLNELLMLGESEAVMAVANAPGISYDTAKDTWWAAMNTEQQPEIAKFLLERKSVQKTELGVELVEFLLEYIPFIEDQAVLLSTIVLLLQSNILSEEKCARLWARSKSKTIYLIGFIVADAEQLPAHDLAFAKKISCSVETKMAQMLKKTLSLSGQRFLLHMQRALAKVPSEDAIYPLLNRLGRWFAPVRTVALSRSYLDFVGQVEVQFENQAGELATLLSSNPELKPQAYAAAVLSGVHEDIVFEAILHTGAVGSQLRKRVKPITDFIDEQIKILLG